MGMGRLLDSRQIYGFLIKTACTILYHIAPNRKFNFLLMFTRDGQLRFASECQHCASIFLLRYCADNQRLAKQAKWGRKRGRFRLLKRLFSELKWQL